MLIIYNKTNCTSVRQSTSLSSLVLVKTRRHESARCKQSAETQDVPRGTLVAKHNLKERFRSELRIPPFRTDWRFDDIRRRDASGVLRAQRATGDSHRVGTVVQLDHLRIGLQVNRVRTHVDHADIAVHRRRGAAQRSTEILALGFRSSGRDADHQTRNFLVRAVYSCC